MKRAHVVLIWLAGAAVAAGQSTMVDGLSYAWSGNLGWIQGKPGLSGQANGFRLGEFSCSGYLWSATTGWIDCGDGTPADGISYSNTSNTDYGVNHYGTGDLYGYAWSPNTGWINFGWATLDPGNPNRPRVNLQTGEFSGYAWSANCGWITLGSGYLRTATMAVTDTDSDGISDAFEIAYTGGLGTMTASSDNDGDGFSDKAEYLALSNPLNPLSYLRITQMTRNNPDGSSIDLTWTSSPARRYLIERCADIGANTPVWTTSGQDPAEGFTPDSGSTTTRTTLDSAATRRFLRVKAVVPLQP